MAPAPTRENSSWPNPPPSRASVSAIYNNSSGSMPSNYKFSHSISAPIPAVGSTSTSNKNDYLSVLRTSVKTLQDEVNAFLTQKMEEDRLHKIVNREGVQGEKAREKTTDEVEEENYGEEGLEDDKGK